MMEMNAANFAHTNHLIHETSPYLLQHAHNPVNWYPWGSEALQKAREEDKPILVSIGYAACHWCHVMAHESFEDPEAAAMMNQWFINIKVDREERPDIDQIYMDAVQAMEGNGGWPLNVFLTPDLKPFYGGTYFPPTMRYGRISWMELLKTIHDAYIHKRETILQQANTLMDYLHEANAIGSPRSNPGLISEEHLASTEKELLAQSDPEWGGFGKAPKFPQTAAIRFLLGQYYHGGNAEAKRHALLSLDKMIQGGIYDQLGGGFSRYSTDKRWQVPHFEKMLYDNAQLVSTLSDAYALTGDKHYKRVIAETIAFVQRELMHPEGGFYSSLDADSEGVEGKFYTWSKLEIEEILGKDAPLFCRVYDVWFAGNWEKTNILWLPETLEKRALEENIPLAELEEILQNCRRKLLEKRSARIRPHTDDKILLGWNALMVIALCDAAAAMNQPAYLALAEKAMLFLEKYFREKSSGSWLHSWKDGRSVIPAFLDDYALLIQAYIRLQEVSANQEYLHQAEKLTEEVFLHFASLGTLFFYTAKEQKDILLRKKDIYDSAIPSGNAMMAQNLYYLSIMLHKPEWGERSEAMLLSIGGGIVHYPASFGIWALLLQQMVYGYKEIAIVGKQYPHLLQQLGRLYLPDKMLIASGKEKAYFPLLAGKGAPGKTLIYLCRNYACQRPVESVEELGRIL